MSSTHVIWIPLWYVPKYNECIYYDYTNIQNIHFTLSALDKYRSRTPSQRTRANTHPVYGSFESNLADEDDRRAKIRHKILLMGVHNTNLQMDDRKEEKKRIASWEKTDYVTLPWRKGDENEIGVGRKRNSGGGSTPLRSMEFFIFLHFIKI